MRNMKLEEIAEKINELKVFGDTPAFCAEVHNRRIYVCRNDGQFHRGSCQGMAGWGTFVGKYTKKEALEFLEEVI